MAQHATGTEQVPESREIVEGRSPATPFAVLAGTGAVVLGLVAAVLLLVVLVVWLVL